MTARHFAFLRAINTGGRRLSNERLLEPFHAAGLNDVSAYQAAGNVAFRSELEPEALERLVEPLITAAYGFDAAVFVRTVDDLRSLVATVPFTADELATTEGRVQITFLRSSPSRAQVAEALALVPDEDRVVFAGREWLWLPQAGISSSALPVGAIERILGPMTMRTVGTVERMLARFTGSG